MAVRQDRRAEPAAYRSVPAGTSGYPGEERTDEDTRTNKKRPAEKADRRTLRNKRVYVRTSVSFVTHIYLFDGRF